MTLEPESDLIRDYRDRFCAMRPRKAQGVGVLVDALMLLEGAGACGSFPSIDLLDGLDAIAELLGVTTERRPLVAG